MFDLSSYDSSDFDRGAPKWVEVVWMISSALVMSIPFFPSGLRVRLLRLFGAKIGSGVVFKSGVKVKFPWRLEVGDSTWIGEGVWIDNLATVSIGKNSCISQGAYLCTGNHNYRLVTFDLMVQEIKIGSSSWVGAFAKLAPGTIVGDEVIICFGSVVSGNLECNSIYKGCPPNKVKTYDRIN